MNKKLKEKIGEAVISVLPITIVVVLTCFFIAPISSDLVVMFIVGAMLLIFGIGLFSLGSETSMSIMGERIGAGLSKSKKIWVIILISFLVGTLTTIAEPDLKVLATQINQIPSLTLVLVVGVGVGIFLACALLRIVFKIKLSRLLVFLYILVFVLAFFVPEDFLPLSFDSGGVTTGPLTVPFIIALGIGAASIRQDKNSESDSFGLVALCSIGPIIAVMILGLIFKIDNAIYVPNNLANVSNSIDIGWSFVSAIPYYSFEVFKSLIPIVLFFVPYNFISLKLPKQELLKIGIGLIYTFIGLVIFMIGVNIGFLPVGNQLGIALMNLENKSFVILLIVLIGFFIVKAEPAVQVLVKQVNDITDGMVSKKALMVSISIGMTIALLISLFRAWLGIPILYVLIPGYVIALALTFFAPEVFVGIAFDSGGVTSGPMTASFVLPIMIGICEASGRINFSIMKDAFGLVSMVAMMPLISIQIVGIIYASKKKQVIKEENEIKHDNDEIIVFKRKNTKTKVIKV